MNISVITRHAVSNYGSILQAFALQTVLERMGHDVEFVDYIRKDEEPAFFECTMLATKPSWNNSPWRQFLYLLLRTPESMIAGRHFACERRRLLKTSRRYTSEESLNAAPPQADVYMVGSDQVWGPVGPGVYDNAYLLSYAPKDAVRMSYASSFGTAKMPRSRVLEMITELRKFKKVLVREDSAVEFLEEWGVRSDQVLDPTLLLDRSSWLDLSVKISRQNYILVYQIHSNPLVGSFAETVAKSMDLPLIRISASLHQAVRQGKFRYLPSVNQFISYISNATLLVTDSFHGTAFAINQNTPFVEVLPTNGTSSRNTSILRLLGLSDRIVHSIDDVAVARKCIDFETVNSILERQREKSLSLLSEALEV